jgi:hypothetical protein
VSIAVSAFAEGRSFRHRGAQFLYVSVFRVPLNLSIKILRILQRVSEKLLNLQRSAEGLEVQRDSQLSPSVPRCDLRD